MNKENISVVICCAGMGTRLGIGSPKALIEIDNKPLILHQLELLKDFDDIRIVVGYQAEKVIEVVNSFRKDVIYVFNYDYENTGPGNSMYKALVGEKKYTLVMDGDLLINKDDFIHFINSNKNIAISNITTDEPILVNIDGDIVTEIGSNGCYEWPGLAVIESRKIKYDLKNVYDIIRKNLPLNYYFIRTRDIDTPEDYERALEWYKNRMKD